MSSRNMLYWARGPQHEYKLYDSHAGMQSVDAGLPFEFSSPELTNLLEFDSAFATCALSDACLNDPAVTRELLCYLSLEREAWHRDLAFHIGETCLEQDTVFISEVLASLIEAAGGSPPHSLDGRLWL